MNSAGRTAAAAAICENASNTWLRPSKLAPLSRTIDRSTAQASRAPLVLPEMGVGMLLSRVVERCASVYLLSEAAACSCNAEVVASTRAVVAATSSTTGLRVLQTARILQCDPCNPLGVESHRTLDLALRNNCPTCGRTSRWDGRVWHRFAKEVHLGRCDGAKITYWEPDALRTRGFPDCGAAPHLLGDTGASPREEVLQSMCTGCFFRVRSISYRRTSNSRMSP